MGPRVVVSGPWGYHVRWTGSFAWMGLGVWGSWWGGVLGEWGVGGAVEIWDGVGVVDVESYAYVDLGLGGGGLGLFGFECGQRLPPAEEHGFRVPDGHVELRFSGRRLLRGVSVGAVEVGWCGV